MISSFAYRQILTKVTPRYFISKTVPTYQEKLKEKYANLPNLEKYAKTEYKSYPYQISHYDPESDDYIVSERDDWRKRIEVDSYNNIIDKMKKDVALQKELDSALANLDRPYLRGKPGVTKNVSGGLKDYFPPEVDHVQQEQDDMNLELAYHPMYRNEKRFIAQTLYHQDIEQPSNVVNWMKERQNRPVNKYYHPDKGSKYDVETPYERRYPYLADRLGHTEFIANPLERLFRLEGDLYHPVYNDQPFVQKPSAYPNENLSFEEGEVLYENTRIVEWAKLWSYSTWLVFLWAGVFVPHNILYKTNMPFEDQLFNNFYPYYMHSIYNFDPLKLNVLGLAGTTAYLSYHLVTGLRGKLGQYVTKVQYSKDKELVFVQRVGPFGGIQESVYETHHLEMIPNINQTAAQYQLNQDGIYELQSLNESCKMLLYKDDNLWNPKLKSEFLSNHTQLITKEHYGLKRLEEKEFLEKKRNPELPTSGPEAV